jgi:hypothetical protein
VLDCLDEHHRRDDRARAGEQRGAERHERHIDVAGRRRLVVPAGQQVERDQQQQQATSGLQRRQRDVQVVQDPLAEDREQHDDETRHEHRLPRCPGALRAGHRRRQRQEDRHRAGRVHDDEQGHERLAQQTQVDDITHGRTTAAPLPCAMISSTTSGSVVFSPNRLGLPAPW